MRRCTRRSSYGQDNPDASDGQPNFMPAAILERQGAVAVSGTSFGQQKILAACWPEHCLPHSSRCSAAPLGAGVPLKSTSLSLSLCVTHASFTHACLTIIPQLGMYLEQGNNVEVCSLRRGVPQALFFCCLCYSKHSLFSSCHIEWWAAIKDSEVNATAP